MSDPEHEPRPMPPWSEEISLGVFEAVEIPRSLLDGPAFSGISAEAYAAQIKLMAFAWHQTPAGSLPDHPATLARHAGVTLEAWGKLQIEALGAWTYCTDERFYLGAWGPTIEGAWGRRRKIKGGNAERQARARMRKSLEAVGVPQVDKIEAAKLDELVAVFRNRGGHEARGQARSEIVTMLASDAGLLPGQVEHDVRLAARISPIRGGR